MNLINYLASDPIAVICLAGLLGLIVGSFLNVVIYRLPIMMERDWRAEYAQFLATQVSKSTHEQTPSPKVDSPTATDTQDQSTVFNLVYPASRCPHCGHHITALENIPIISYLWQRGQCTACQHSISSRYPLIEGVSALLTVVTAWHFGFGWALGGALLLTWALLASSMIDVDHQLLPDSITLPFLWLGIACNLFDIYPYVGLQSSVMGAMLGYLSLWSVYWLFKLVTGKEGMGYGDFKLLAMLGAWMGWQILPMIVLMSSLVGAIVGISLIVLNKQDKDKPIPFGPYLACAGWINLLWGPALSHSLPLFTVTT